MNKMMIKDGAINKQLREQIQKYGIELIDQKKELFVRNGASLRNTDFVSKKIKVIVDKIDGGKASSKRLLHFQFDNREKQLDLNLLIGPGEKSSRQYLYNLTDKNDLFNTRQKNLSNKWSGIYRTRLLDYGSNPEIEKTKLFETLKDKFETFCKTDLLKIEKFFTAQHYYQNFVENKSDEIEDDITKINNDNSLSGTDKTVLIKARKGQGKYRESLIEYWKACSITGCKNPNFLRASHIRPWKDSNNKQRLDPYNGFLLTANFDLLFDQGFISFCNKGNIIISNALDLDTQNILGVEPSISINLVEEHLPYLEFHRNEVFRKYN